MSRQAAATLARLGNVLRIQSRLDEAAQRRFGLAGGPRRPNVLQPHAARVRQPVIEQDHVRFEVVHSLDRGLAVLGLAYLRLAKKEI